MSSGPLVSVVIPTKNAERYLRDALESVRAQTYEAWQVVLVDAGSTDRTVAIARSYDRVDCIGQTGAGLADAWNCGLGAARGDLIAFLDSDDCWEPAKLSAQVQVLEADPAVDCVITRMRFVLEPGLPPPAGFRPLLLESSHVAHMPSALLARREVFERIGSFDTELTVAPDIDWFARVKDSGLRVAVVPRVLVYKRMHDANLSSLAGETVNREIVQLLKRSIGRQRSAR